MGIHSLVFTKPHISHIRDRPLTKSDFRVGGSKVTKKNGRKGVKIVGDRQTSFMDVPLNKHFTIR